MSFAFSLRNRVIMFWQCMLLCEFSEMQGHPLLYNRIKGKVGLGSSSIRAAHSDYILLLSYIHKIKGTIDSIWGNLKTYAC